MRFHALEFSQKRRQNMAKTLTVEFKDATSIPGAVLGGKKDRDVGAGEAIKLPFTYAQHVVDEGFAVVSDGKAKTAAKGVKTESSQLASQLAAVKKDLAEKSGLLLKAETDLSAANTKIGEMASTVSEFDAAFAAVEVELTETKAELKRRDLVDAQSAVEAADVALAGVAGTSDENAARGGLAAAQAALVALQD
jgi:hypothetical protein